MTGHLSSSDPENHERQSFYLSQLASRIHVGNRQVGWWDDAIIYLGTTEDKYLVPTKLALAHSEISEALEGERKNLVDDHLPIFPMIQVEIADAIIRLLDLAEYLTTTRDYAPIGLVVEAKLGYNAGRADHKRENRQLEGGKSV